MDIITEPELLSQLWETLNESSRRQSLHRAERNFLKSVQEGWSLRSDVEDMLDWLDPRLSDHRFNLVNISTALGIYWEPVCFKPKMIAHYVSEYDGLRTEQVALLLIVLERIGFQTDPSRLVELLMPGLKSRPKKFFSAAELDIFWFKKTRHKCAPITIMGEGATTWHKLIGRIRTTAGYQITLKGDDHGNPTLLNVRAPKYREKKDPVEVTCKLCGSSWYKGDPESSQNHRKQHRITMSYLDPNPHDEVLKERNKNIYSELVTASSPKWKHKEMYLRARAFKRELGFDFIQWLSPDSKQERDTDIEGMLFTDDSCAIIGACGFRHYKEPGSPNYWGLQWIWVCPKARRNGHLTTRWKSLRERYLDFYVEPPVSDAMQAFLASKNESNLMNYRDKAEATS